jgi:hypothetical protein
LNEKCSHALISIVGKQRQIDAANFVCAGCDGQPADWFAAHQHELIARVLMIALKITLSYVLHLEKLTDSIFIPTKPAQIVAAAALVKQEQKGLVRFCDRTDSE